MPLDELNLPERWRSILRESGVTTVMEVEALAKLPDTKINERVPGCGSACARDLRNALAEYRQRAGNGDAQNEKPDHPKTFQEAFLASLWSISPRIRTIFLLVIVLVVAGFAVWSELPPKPQESTIDYFLKKQPDSAGSNEEDNQDRLQENRQNSEGEDKQDPPHVVSMELLQKRLVSRIRLVELGKDYEHLGDDHKSNDASFELIHPLTKEAAFLSLPPVDTLPCHEVIESTSLAAYGYVLAADLERDDTSKEQFATNAIDQANQALIRIETVNREASEGISEALKCQEQIGTKHFFCKYVVFSVKVIRAQLDKTINSPETRKRIRDKFEKEVDAGYRRDNDPRQDKILRVLYE